jgi:hypothetical protein
MGRWGVNDRAFAVLAVAVMGLQLGVAATTVAGIHNGAVEANPVYVMCGLPVEAFAFSGILVVSGMVVALALLRNRFPKATLAMIAVAAAVKAADFALNLPFVLEG